MEIQHGGSSLKGTWSLQVGDLFTNLRTYAREAGILGIFSKNKGACRCHFSPYPPSLNKQTPTGTSAGQYSQSKLLTAHPALMFSCGHVPFSQAGFQVPSHSRPAQNLLTQEAQPPLDQPHSPICSWPKSI